MIKNKYTCPNHPEVSKNVPGECPKCGLLLEDSKGNVVGIKIHKKGRLSTPVSNLKKQKPLFAILSIVFVTIFLFSTREYARGEFSATNTLSNIIGSLMLVFGGLKLLDLRGFAQGFAKYDLIAKQYEIYGSLYPFLQVVLAFAFLLNLGPISAGFTTFAIFSISASGVLAKLLKGEKHTDVSLGTYIPMPLSYFSLIESLGLSLLAFGTLVYHWL